MKMFTLTSKLPMFPLDIKGAYPNYQIDCQADNVSDGYHTMEELYQHRYHLFLALVKVIDNYITPLNGPSILCWKSKLHDDGTMFEDSFILGMTVTKRNFVAGTDEDFRITYHLPMRYWNFINVIALPKAPPHDGHTSDDVLKNLLRI